MGAVGEENVAAGRVWKGLAREAKTVLVFLLNINNNFSRFYSHIRQILLEEFPDFAMYQ